MVQYAEERLRQGWLYCNGESGQCKAGGLLNFAKAGIRTDHPNYGLPHVTGWYGPGEDDRATNCFYCGEDLSRFCVPRR